MFRIAPPLLGPLFCAVAVTMFATNDATMKHLSDDYALHQLVSLRSVLGSIIVLGIMAPLAGGWRVLRTQRLGLHLLRAGFVFFANLCFFLGIAALPLAEATAIFFVAPFLISVFSVVFLGETVGPHRWAAIGFGFLGVVIVLRPGTEAFQPAALYPIGAAIGYSALHILTRRMRNTDNAVSMVFYIQVFFLAAGVAMGLAFGDGRFSDTPDPSLAFLFRAWVVPTVADWPFIIALSVFATVGGYCISQAYRLGEAALVAPVEYLTLPLSILLGAAIFGEWPDAVAWVGIALIIASGLYTIWRDNRARHLAETFE